MKAVISADLENLFTRLRERNVKLSLAESCTGGLLSSWITGFSGISDIFLGSVVSYSNDAKVKLLSVLPESLQAFGAVSEQVAVEMARGAMTAFESQCQVAITGIAGPGGGSTLKPVGTVCFCVRGPGFEQTLTERFEGDRLAIQEQAAHFGVRFLLENLAFQAPGSQKV